MSCSAFPRSGPSPTISSLAATRSRIRAKMRTTASTCLTGTQVRDVNHQLLAWRAKPLAQRWIRCTAMKRAVEKIRNHHDVAVDPHVSLGFVTQAC